MMFIGANADDSPAPNAKGFEVMDVANDFDNALEGRGSLETGRGTMEARGNGIPEGRAAAGGTGGRSGALPGPVRLTWLAPVVGRAVPPAGADRGTTGGKVGPVWKIFSFERVALFLLDEATDIGCRRTGDEPPLGSIGLDGEDAKRDRLDDECVGRVGLEDGTGIGRDVGLVGDPKGGRASIGRARANVEVGATVMGRRGLDAPGRMYGRDVPGRGRADRG